MASVTSVSIANMALSHVGASSIIESLTEGSPEANECKRWYDFCLDQSLESYDWGFARKRQALAPSSSSPPDQWAYRYQYPAECLKFRRIWNPLGDDADAIPYEIELDDSDNKSIVTDMTFAIGIFTKRIANPAMYSRLFVELLARCLAHHIAYPLTAKRELAKDQADAYSKLLQYAPAADANERVGKPPRDAEWIRARGYVNPFGNCR